MVGPRRHGIAFHPSIFPSPSHSLQIGSGMDSQRRRSRFSISDIRPARPGRPLSRSQALGRPARSPGHMPRPIRDRALSAMRRGNRSASSRRRVAKRPRMARRRRHGAGASQAAICSIRSLCHHLSARFPAKQAFQSYGSRGTGGGIGCHHHAQGYAQHLGNAHSGPN